MLDDNRPARIFRRCTLGATEDSSILGARRQLRDFKKIMGSFIAPLVTS